jgi:hypothetical protein
MNHEGLLKTWVNFYFPDVSLPVQDRSPSAAELEHLVQLPKLALLNQTRMERMYFDREQRSHARSVVLSTILTTNCQKMVEGDVVD